MGSTFFNKKNEILPFEDATKLEFFAQKNDASLFMFGNHIRRGPTIWSSEGCMIIIF